MEHVLVEPIHILLLDLDGRGKSVEYLYLKSYLSVTTSTQIQRTDTNRSKLQCDCNSWILFRLIRGVLILMTK